MSVVVSSGRGSIKALSFEGSLRRGREEIERVVANRRWLQKRQWWVWTGRWVCGGDGDDIVVFVRLGDGLVSL